MTTSTLACLLGLCLFQATPPTFEVGDPATLDFDAAKLTEIDPLMQAEVDAGRIVGCLALAARGDQVAYFHTWGQRDRERNLPMTADTIFRIYSMSKPITSAAAMQLVEQGRMQLDDPVSKYIPAFRDMKVLVTEGDTTREVPAERPITIRHLMSHTSGLTYGFFGNTEVDKAYRKAGVLMTDATIEETVNKLGRLPLLYQPGTRWHYSVSTDVLGRVVEVVSGERFDRYLQQHIFKPLQMTDTFFVVPAEKRHRLAQLYTDDGKGGLKPAPALRSIRFVSDSNRFFSGGGGLCSTTSDYYRFCRALLHGGELEGQRILRPESIREMTRNQLKQPGFRFGLGFAISPEGEYSWGGAAGTRFYINPKRDLIGIYMIQINPYGRRKYGEQVKRIVYAADKRKAPAADAATAPMP